MEGRVGGEGRTGGLMGCVLEWNRWAVSLMLVVVVVVVVNFCVCVLVPFSFQTHECMI